MPSPVVIAIAVAVVVIVLVYWQTKKTPGPAPPTPSCYKWTSIKVSDKKLPAGTIVGYSASMMPAGAKGPDGAWYLGGTSGNPNDQFWGNFIVGGGSASFKPDEIWVLMLNDGATCQNAATLKPFDGTAGTALKFNGLGVCFNFGAVQSAFTSANSAGMCTQWGGLGAFNPVADQAP